MKPTPGQRRKGSRRAKRRATAPTLVAQRLRSIAIQAMLVAAVAGTAIVTKEFGRQPIALAAVSMPTPQALWIETAPVPPATEVAVLLDLKDAIPAQTPAEIDETPALPPDIAAFAADPSIRWFNGRPARPARELWMEVTAYSPDWRSCGESADGLTATLHSVETNGHALVAADPTLLPYGSMLTIPGYDNDRIVPVLDCGGAIKGRRLDVLYPTHEQARQWGRQRLRVIVWEYADGLPAENPRAAR